MWAHVHPFEAAGGGLDLDPWRWGWVLGTNSGPLETSALNLGAMSLSVQILPLPNRQNEQTSLV